MPKQVKMRGKVRGKIGKRVFWEDPEKLGFKKVLVYNFVTKIAKTREVRENVFCDNV